jgi:hypothetical protein
MSKFEEIKNRTMKNLFKSLATFQQEVPVIFKDTQAYGYKYADLPRIFEVINPLMKSNGLGFTQLIEGDVLKTIVFHVESGEFIESTLNIPQDVQLKGMNEFQVMGSAITYLRRYAISSMLGLVTDKDNDAQGEQLPKQQPQPVKEKPLFTEANFEKAKAAGATIDRIKQAYTITPDVEQKYLDYAKK